MWPPDDQTWPPRDYSESSPLQLQAAGIYGSTENGYSDGENDIGGGHETFHRQRRTTFRTSVLRIILISVFALSLIIAMWLPVLESQGTSEPESFYKSNDDDDDRLLRNYKSTHDSNESNDDDDDDIESIQRQRTASLRHRHFDRRGKTNPITLNTTAAIDLHEFHGPRSIGSDVILFADLAAEMVPHHLQSTVELLTNTISPCDDGEGGIMTCVGPGEVFDLRKSMLKTRDLFDVFSPVYRRDVVLDDAEYEDSIEHFSLTRDGAVKFQLAIETDRHRVRSRTKRDVWKILRRFLDDGYTLIGEFQG